MIYLVNDLKYPNMYRLRWEDGTTSTDLYNLQRAKELQTLASNRAEKTKGMLEYGTKWDFPKMGCADGYDTATFVFRGKSYWGSQWVEITHPAGCIPPAQTSYEKEVING